VTVLFGLLTPPSCSNHALPVEQVRDLTAAVGAPLFVCTATGAAEVTAPADTAHCRGGFFCDEPVRLPGQLRLENSGVHSFRPAVVCLRLMA